MTTNEDEAWKTQNQARWKRMEKSWRFTAEKHASPQGWAMLGYVQGEGGRCECPVCQVVRQMDEREAADA